MVVPQGPNQRWALDLVSDTLVDGRKFRILCVVDDFSRECLTTVVDNSLWGTGCQGAASDRRGSRIA